MVPAGSPHMRAIVIGIGNQFRGDDAVGLEVIRRLREDLPPGVDAIQTEADGATLMQIWAGYDTVILVDCVVSGQTVGTRIRLDAVAQQLPTRFFRSSSHLFGVAEAVEMSRALKQLPKRMIVYGVEGVRFELGDQFSPEVKRGLGELVAEIRLDLVQIAAGTVSCE